MINRSLKITLSLITISILIVFSYLVFFSEPTTSEETQIESKTLEKIKNITEGNENASVEILIFESLTCPHCAVFHSDIYPDLKKNFIDKSLVKIQFKSFPLDIVALDASKIAHCKNDGKSDILHFLYNNQSIWLKGEAVEQLNVNLKNIIDKGDFGIDFNKCINNEIIENHILEDRIESAKKFKIDSTPTIIINNKKFDKPLTYKNLKKAIEKLI